VFNLSLGSYAPLASLSARDLQERSVQLQDLDNFAFQNDLVVVVAAGNTPNGVVPNVDYPGHVDEREWGLGAWAAGFNSLVVGGYVADPNTNGIARNPGWPSPFTRVGPGVAKAPVPNFSAGAGDSLPQYRWRPGQHLGVSTLNQNGDWEDAVGTSFAAPVVAREAAFILQDLRRHCGPGAHPFAATAKAFMRLVAHHAVSGGKFPPSVQPLAARTLGQGCPHRARLLTPTAESAVFLWQGTLEKAGQIARVRVPIPRSWLDEAKSPQLRAVAAWNTPAFAGAPQVWACRKVQIKLRSMVGGKALRGSGNATGAYPLVDRTYNLSTNHLEDQEIVPRSDEWVVEVEYSDVGPYPPALRIDEQQRVAIALELFDKSDLRISPQLAVQAMPVTTTMVHLGGTKQAIWSPIKIPTG